MATGADDVLARALALDAAEREEIALRLLDSLEPVEAGADAEWADELRRRVADCERRDIRFLPWAELRRRMQSRLD